MKKGMTFIFLIFAVVFTLPMFLMFPDVVSGEIPIVAVLIFGFMDLLLWGLFFSQIVKAIKSKKIEKDGTEFTATFVSYASNVSVNNVPMFYITYVWENEQGERIEGKSSSDYTIQEAEAFERAKKFQIKAIGNQSIIISKPSLLVAEFKGEVTTDGKAVCEYCSSVFDIQQDKCPHCGATRVE